MKNKVLNKLLLLSMLAVLSIVGYALFASDHSIVFAQEQAPAEQPKAPANPPEPPKAPEPPKEPVASKTYTKDEPHPTIQFEVITFDFGESTQNADLTHDFKFKNVGQRELEIVNVQGGWGCVATLSSDKVVPPGGEGSIKVTFKTGHYQGQRSKTVSVTTNDPENPKLTLTVNANIVVDFALQPPHLYMGRFSKNDTTVRTTKVIAKEPAKLKITKVTPSNDLLSAKIVESKPQAPAPDDPNKKIEKVEPPKDDSGLELEVTLKPGMKVGRFNEKITLETNIEKVPTYELNVSGEVLGDIQIEPRLVSLRGEGQEKEFSSSVKIFTDNQDVKFKVTKAACEDPKFETTIETVEKDRSYKINVVYKGEPPEKYVRSKLLVSTDSPEQPEIELPVYLSVKPPEDASVKQPDVPPSTANTLEKAIQQTAPKEQPKDKPKDPPKDK